MPSSDLARTYRRGVFIVVLLALIIPMPSQLYAADPVSPFHATTQWDLQASLKFDAICALNMLSGDPYYLEYYQAEHDRLSKQFRPDELAAFVNLKRRIKDQNGGIISASLALYFSASEAESLDDLIRTVQDSSAMRRNLQATPYYSDDGWRLYEASRPDLESSFRALKRIHFDEDWEKNVKPKVEQSRAL